ncbi:MAG: hypothetical protein KF734_11985 [Saprospiraceae bacterium]|nr:hypothetical protein [Saprospiraceae bacterium]
MQQHFGIITLGAIENMGEKGGTVPVVTTKFVHYPDCQQLIIWLPKYGRDYGSMRLIDLQTKQIVWEHPVTDKLSGSIQLLWDTLDVAPGEYMVEIDHPEGWQHRVFFKKYHENEEVPVEKPALETPTEAESKSSAPIIYRDGFGNVIPDEDLILREKVLRQITNKFTRRIEYTGNFRAGEVIYIDNEHRIQFYHEMGGGNCMFYIDIPTAQEWEARTGAPLSSRQEILEFVAQTVHAQQASSTRYEIGEREIIFYYRR